MNFKILSSLALLSMTFCVVQAQENLTKPEQTEFYEPVPKVITPAVKVGDAPSDAIVLFNGKDLASFESAKDGSAALWTFKPADTEGGVTVNPGKGDIRTKQSFGDCQLHIEWRSPMEPDSLKGQKKGNSGVFFFERYEVQVLNCYQNTTYTNGQAGSIYKQTPPLVNACRKPGEWQTYDIIFTAPRWRKNGSMEKPGYLTVIHNGIIVQNHTEIQGTSEYIGPPIVKAHGMKGQIKLQDHGNLVSYRNIWVREL